VERMIVRGRKDSQRKERIVWIKKRYLKERKNSRGKERKVRIKKR